MIKTRLYDTVCKHLIIVITLKDLLRIFGKVNLFVCFILYLSLLLATNLTTNPTNSPNLINLSNLCHTNQSTDEW